MHLKSGVDLATSRCTLRPIADDDEEALHRLWTSPGVRRFLWDDERIARERTHDAIARSGRLFAERGFGLWGLWPNDVPRLGGFAGLWFFRDPPELELLYGVAEPLWGQGYATEAAQAVINYGFDSPASSLCGPAPSRLTWGRYGCWRNLAFG